MRHKLGLPVPIVVLLAALAVPRVVTHDLGVFPEGSPINSLLVFVPPAIWLAVVLWLRAPRPFLTLAAVGLAYGVMLAVGHQLIWAAAYGGDPPSLGGNLEGALGPGVESAVLRASAFLSSLVTGTLVGALVGAVAWAIARLRRT
jgi:hypothetical protein